MSVASPTAYERKSGGSRDRQSAIRSPEISMPETQPLAPTAANHAFAQKARAATDIQHALASREREQLQGLRSLRDHIGGEVDLFELPRGIFGEYQPAHCGLEDWV